MMHDTDKYCLKNTFLAIFMVHTYTVYREIFPRFIFAHFTFVVSGVNQDWVNSNVSNNLSLNTTLSEQIQDWAKPFESNTEKK